ncbi:YfcC family protein [Gracilibacillus sp. HCP3S3_G5_1]|uniref:YfcC family protein n=1 Tax=unclassified Gracilibacillus TaxID=2625209 RepID=UPI003F898ED0
MEQQAAYNLKPKKQRKFKMPHIYSILFILATLAALATYIIPAGIYDRVDGPEGRTTIDPNSYQTLESNPIDFVGFISAIPLGLIDAGEVVFFTFIIGGMFMVLRRTGIIDIAVDRLTRRFKNNKIIVIPTLMFVFALICSMIGTQELTLVYVPVILPLLIALGYDSITAVGIALISTTAGFTAGVLNPINTGLAQQIADISLYSGIGLRLLLFFTLVSIGCIWVMRYAKKVERNPVVSLTFKEDQEKRKKYNSIKNMKKIKVNRKQKYAGFVAILFVGLLVYGVLRHGWFMIEMAGLFIIMGIVVGLIAGLNTSQIAKAFNDGFHDVLMGAIIVGLARAVAVIMEEGQVMDTVIYGLGQAVENLPTVLGATGMFVIQLLFNFLIPSGSGQALVTMPILAPLSDLMEVTRQTAVLSYQLGDGIGNILYPTSGYFMATLALAGVAWQKWVKFYLPLFFIWIGVALIFLIISQLIGWHG